MNREDSPLFCDFLLEWLEMVLEKKNCRKIRFHDLRLTPCFSRME